MTQAVVFVAATMVAIGITAPIAYLLHESMVAKNAAMDYLTRRTLEMPPPPPRPRQYDSPAEYFAAAAEWDKRFKAYCAKYP